jgi:hypothetical protein
MRMVRFWGGKTTPLSLVQSHTLEEGLVLEQPNEAFAVLDSENGLCGWCQQGPGCPSSLSVTEVEVGEGGAKPSRMHSLWETYWRVLNVRTTTHLQTVALSRK